MTFKEIQNKVISDYNIRINEHSTCRRRMHAHVNTRTVCKWCQKNSIRATFDLFHEIGHIETTKTGMRRCESEFFATEWAIEKCLELGLEIPDRIIELYQWYIYEELARGIRRGGKNYPTKEQLKLKC